VLADSPEWLEGGHSLKSMDKKLGEEVAAWLEFYRDLGIDEFYRRDPGPQLEAGNPQLETGQQPEPSLTAESVPAASQPPIPHLDPRVPSPEPRVTRAQALSLFEAPPPPRREHETLEEIRQDLGDCQRCRLAQGRKTIVFGQGNPHAELVFVGEGPGADEDEQGLPFVGRAGQLLNRMIQFVGMKREEVYICNIVKCRPPGNRTPEKDEIDTCSPFLFRQIEAIRPRLVCCLGAPAMKTLLGIKEGITRVRGRFFDYAGTKAFVAYHPAYILRNPREEKILREDFEKIREFLRSSG
jgi:uracil-DNA glycosylase family 4